MPEILSEYLVRLGFAPDMMEFAKFSSVLHQASSLVADRFGGMVKDILEWQTGLTGAFASAGMAAVSFADSAAMSDQSYRLLALHMYASLPVARELKIALDALGEPLENIMWDPELAGRFQQLVMDQEKMTETLGPGFENQMHKIRDLRFEFSRFGVELRYLMMDVVKLLAESFGTNIDGLLQKMRQFNAYIIEHMPEIAAWISKTLKPALVDVWNVLKEATVATKDFATAFTNIVGSISGDTSIEGTTFDWQNFGKAIQITAHWLAEFVTNLTKAEEIAAHLLSALADWHSGNYEAMNSELNAAKSLATQGTVTVLGGIAGAAGGAMVGTAAGTSLLGPIAGPLLGGPTGAVLGGIGGALWGHYLTNAAPFDPRYIPQTIAGLAKVMGVDPALALAVANIESGYQQYDASGKPLMSKIPGSHAMGIFQLEPQTAKMLGVNAADPYGNVYGGIKFLKQLLATYHGDTSLALQHYYGSKNVAENLAYAQRVLQKESEINRISVDVEVNIDSEGLVHKTVRVMKQQQQKKVQRHLSEFSLSGTSH